MNSFFVTPVELVRTRLMLQYGRSTQISPKLSSSAGGGSGGVDRLRGPVDCVRQIVGRHGVLGMWQARSTTPCHVLVRCAGNRCVSVLQMRALVSYMFSECQQPTKCQRSTKHLRKSRSGRWPWLFGNQVSCCEPLVRSESGKDDKRASWTFFVGMLLSFRVSSKSMPRKQGVRCRTYVSCARSSTKSKKNTPCTRKRLSVVSNVHGTSRIRHI